ncbi:MAG: PQQ-binding-like beta-propeller repeat protein [Desulfobacteraceae bacterium]
MWDAATGRLWKTISGHENSVNSVVFSPDGSTIASASDDNTIRLWNADSGRELRIISGHEGSVSSAAFSSNGGMIVSASGDRTIRLWDADTGLLLRTISGHETLASSAAFSPDGKLIVSANYDNTIGLWDADTGQLRDTFPGNESLISSVAFSPDGKTIVSANYDNTIRLWNTATGRLVRTIYGHEGLVSSVAFSPDGGKIISTSYDNRIRLWDTATGQLLRTISGPENLTVHFAAYSPDGGTILSASYDNTIRLWNATTGRPLRTISGHEGLISSTAFSPDGGMIVSTSGDNTIRLWDAGSGRLLRIISDHEGSVNSAAFSPDGGKIVSASQDGTIRLWDSGSGQLLRTISGLKSWVNSAAFSPDGGKIVSASGDRTICLWDTATGLLLQTFTGYAGRIYFAAFSPVGDTIVSVDSETQILFWRAEESNPQMVIIPLPTAGEWIAHKPGHLFYHCSKQGDEKAAVRFNNQLRDIYPLSYYRDQLKMDNWYKLVSGPLPEISRKPIRRWWDRMEQKRLRISLLIASVVVAIAFVRVLQWRSNPMKMTIQFFNQAGYPKIDSANKKLVQLRTEQGQVIGLVTIWNNNENFMVLLQRQLESLKDKIKLYLIYSENQPTMKAVHQLREKGCEVILISSRQIEKSLITQDAASIKNTLKVLEEPFITRSDPYLESRPIHDATWFFGRDRLMEDLPAVLSQGHHVGVFGLRKVGKTSLIQQIRHRFVTTATVFIDCQTFDPRADLLLEEILNQIHSELAARSIKGLPSAGNMQIADFGRHIQTMYACWKKAGQNEPFLIIFDEVDKLFTERSLEANAPILAEYVRLFRILRGLAQSHNCLVTFVVAYRPDINRHNLLTAAVGENPMFKSFQEHYLGFLDIYDSTRMLTEIGAWKDIFWQPKTAERVYHYCGGHPLVTRYFASQVCQQGSLKHIDMNTVEETAKNIVSTFRRNDIGNYYKEGVWKLLNQQEQHLLSSLLCNDSRSFPDALKNEAFEEALVGLENFGLVCRQEKGFAITANLFRCWLQRRLG